MHLYCAACLCAVSHYTTYGGESAIICSNPRCRKTVALAVASEALLNQDERRRALTAIQERIDRQQTSMAADVRLALAATKEGEARA
jgi:hypothetical protein